MIDIKSFKSVWGQVLFNEITQMEKRLFYHFNAISWEVNHFTIIPDVGVQKLQSVLRFEEIIISFVISLKNVVGYEACTHCNLWRSIIKEQGIIQLEFANLIGHIVDCLVFIVVKDPQVSFHALDGSREVVVEAHDHKDICFKIYQLLFSYILFLVIREKCDHPWETWRDRLF